MEIIEIIDLNGEVSDMRLYEQFPKIYKWKYNLFEIASCVAFHSKHTVKPGSCPS